jgi:WhiB family redox-sensing transcriptional regulator
MSYVEGTKKAAPASPKDVLRYDNLGALRLASACNGLDPDMFFPDESDELAEYEAKAVCGNCVIRVACLEYSLEAKEAYGIWGGATERERRRILRQRSKQKMH